MKIISLWQPWASLFVYGEKQIETRSWPVPKTLTMPFTLGVHAAKAWDKILAEAANKEPIKTSLSKCGWASHPGTFYKPPRVCFDRPEPFGALLGTVEIYDCVPTNTLAIGYGNLTHKEFDFGDYSQGRFGWLARNFNPFKEPIPMRGFQGIWEAEYDARQEARGL